MVPLLLELTLCLLVGLALGRAAPRLPGQLAPPLLRWGVPISLVGLLLKGGLQQDNLLAGIVALLVCSTGLFITWRLPLLRQALPTRSLQLGAVVGNTAYFGLPVAIALLPSEALSFSITYDLVGTLLTWSLGPLLLDGVRVEPRQLLRNLLGTPVVQAVLVALPLLASPWSQTLSQLLWWPARAVLWLMLLLVGMRLGLLLSRRSSELARKPLELAGALVIKLVLLPAFVLLGFLLFSWPPLVRDALVLQAAAPTAMSVLLLAEASQQGGRESIPAAQLVLWSTLMALLSVPLWWWLLNQLGVQPTAAM